MSFSAILAFEDGSVFQGIGYGKEKYDVGEIVFNTSMSGYQEIITDHVWAKNRHAYGYRDLEQFHLMTTFYGTPYIDIRIDFNSWLPEKLEKFISTKL